MASSLNTSQTKSSSIASAPLQQLTVRPFGDTETETEDQGTADLQTQLSHAALFGHALSAPQPIQRQGETDTDLDEEDESPVQAKLTIGQPNDKYEQEADQVAAKVMRMPEGELEEEDNTLQAKPNIQAKGVAPAVPENFENQLGQHKGGGRPLSDETRAYMEPRFGADFGSVRVHEAPTLASSIQAQALTHGQDIYFNSGKYNPGSSSGKELLAHELTHVVQQVGGTAQAKLIQNKQTTQFQEEEPSNTPAKQISALTSEALSNKNPLQTKTPAAAQTEKTAGNQEDQTQAKKALSDVDPAEKEQKKTELVAKTQPEVDQKQLELEQAGQEAQQASQATEQPSEQIGEAQAPKAPQGQTAQSASGQPQQADVPQQTSAQSADSPALPEQPQAVIPPEPVMPVDAGGMPLPGNPEVDAQIIQLAKQAQSLRDGGNQLLARAAQIRANAQIIRGNIQLVKQGVSQSEQGVTKTTEQLNFRQETLGQAKQALEVSEQKATTVAEQAPSFVGKSNQGQEKTQPMVSQANDLAGQSAANTHEDPEAAGKSREQGQKLNKVATDTATMDGAFSQTKAKAEELAAEAAQAQGINTQTSTQIGEMETTLGQSQERLTQMSEQNQQARTQAESLEGKPDEMISQAGVLEEKGRTLIQASVEIEQRLQQIQAEYQQAMNSVPAAKVAEQTGGSATGVIQRDIEEGRYDERENIDLVGDLSEAAPWLTGVDPATEEQRQAAAEAAEARRQQQITQINSIAGGSFENLSAGQKIGISLELMGQNIANSLSNIEWPDWRQLALSLVDPRTALTGVIGGLSQILSGGANLFSAEQWSKDPLGNFLKSAADIATGLTIILGSITALAAVITAIMGAITLVSLGTAAPVTGPVIAFCATVMTTVGGMTFKVGLVAAALHGLVLIKNLYDAATAETAEDLQNQSEQMTEDTKNAGGALLQAGMGKLAQWGGRKLQGNIAQAGGGKAYAAAMPGRVVTKVGNARQWLGQRFGRNKPTPASDPGLANRGYRPKPGERSMTREQWKAQDRSRRAGQSKAGQDVTRLDEPLGGTYRRGPQRGQPRMGHTARGHRASKTNQQLQNRASSSNIEAATRFANDPTHLRVVRTMRREAISGARGLTRGQHNLPNGTLEIIRRPGNTPTVGERLILSGRQFNFTTGRGFFGRRAPGGQLPGTPTGPLQKATLVLEMTGVDSSGNPIYKIVTAHPSL